LPPGDCVSVDQLERNTPGLVPQTRGSPTKTTFQAATLFCDHASQFLHLTSHSSTGAPDAISAKQAFEREDSLAIVTIKKVRADNGIINSIAWKTTCDALQQQTINCGINAHHQNGIAEQQICTTVDCSHTMLIHAIHKWPDVIHVDLWPHALKLAVDLHNSTPGPTGLSPAKIFTGVKDRNQLQDFHTFGCPVFVLEACLQTGHKIPKWEPHSRMAIYLGRSPQHVTNAPFVMSIATGIVSPLFHMVSDDHFSTTQSYKTNSLPTNWTQLFQERSGNVLVYNPMLRDAHTLGPEWDSSLPKLAYFMGSDIHQMSPVNLYSEGGICGSPVILTSEGGTDDISHSTTPAVTATNAARPGWNSGHQHNNHFWKHLMAANSLPDPSIFPTSYDICCRTGSNQ
jgi:hypothetical protein